MTIQRNRIRKTNILRTREEALAALARNQAEAKRTARRAANTRRTNQTSAMNYAAERAARDNS